MDSCSGSNLRTLSDANTKSFITSKRLDKSKQRLLHDAITREQSASAKEYQLLRESINSPIQMNRPHTPYAFQSKANDPKNDSLWADEFKSLQNSKQETYTSDVNSHSSLNPMSYPNLATENNQSTNFSPSISNYQFPSSSSHLQNGETNRLSDFDDSYMQLAFQQAEQFVQATETKQNPMAYNATNTSMNLTFGLTAIGATDDDACDPDYNDL
ncbi:hypothetical protein SOMG_01628 [Schizosaccharomyces osmophilus]|uniref:Uncharacterized protein n=1 Tax=Schizosaccharomyces osmophilus TaxID=2545709 RepID=A0AAE9W9M6_9SCHI|nr:uncharacterized protein SOMG_01628 [Schizosaccharomyces osmophilus]WBW72277.1 hypothetical protein SOMG_01628 [Schizosaccharomyces osmophilus]